MRSRELYCDPTRPPFVHALGQNRLLIGTEGDSLERGPNYDDAEMGKRGARAEAVELYLVQHGEAKSEAEDPERSLTEQGEATVHRIAIWAVRAAVTVDQIRHSGKKRAAQTAAILAAALQPSKGSVAVSGLNPNDDVSLMAESLQTESGAVMLVSHLPFLKRLASLLAAGDPGRDIIRFQNAGIVCLSRQDGRWSIRWAVPPELLEGGRGRRSAV